MKEAAPIGASNVAVHEQFASVSVAAASARRMERLDLLGPGERHPVADKPLELLRTRGFRARRLAEGLPEWRLAGLSVVSGEKP